MKLGVITEAGIILDVVKKNIAYGKEIDIINVGEEIADMCWYIVNNFTQRGESLTNMTYGWSPVNSLIDVVEYVETLILLWADREETRIYNKIGVLKAIAEYFELDFFQILTNNIDKLKIRYPDKFSTEKALNRNLDAERIELEK